MTSQTSPVTSQNRFNLLEYITSKNRFPLFIIFAFHQNSTNERDFLFKETSFPVNIQKFNKIASDQEKRKLPIQSPHVIFHLSRCFFFQFKTQQKQIPGMLEEKTFHLTFPTTLMRNMLTNGKQSRWS